MQLTQTTSTTQRENPKEISQNTFLTLQPINDINNDEMSKIQHLHAQAGFNDRVQCVGISWLKIFHLSCHAYHYTSAVHV